MLMYAYMLTLSKEDPMRRLRRFLWLALFAVCATLATAPLEAATVNTLNYFANAYPSVCVAESPSIQGSFYRTFQEPSNQCPGLAVYHQVKGGGTSPWGTESFYIDAGWIWQMNEISYNDSNGAITHYRVFRNLTNHWKGIKWLPTSFSSWGQSFTPLPAVVETWTDDQGVPVCLNTKQTNVPFPEFDSWVGVTSLSQWVQDKRSISLNQSTWHDLDAIVRQDVWGTVNRERYWYGRWLDPATGTWKPLGLVRWLWEQNVGGVWQVQGQIQLRYIVDCTVNVPCSTCPP